MAMSDKRLQEIKALGGTVAAAEGVLEAEATVQQLLEIPANHPDATATRQLLLKNIILAAEAVPELVVEIESLRKVVADIEWNGDEEGDDSCPRCGGRKPLHRAGCGVALALGH
jgi:hypothetical protein